MTQMTTQSTSSAKRLAKLWLCSLVGFAIALGLLRSYPLSVMGPVTIMVVIILLGWLVYQYLEPVRLMNRHAFLSHVAVEGSRFRKWFWHGTLLRFRLVFSALFTAVLALLLTARLEDHEWLVILGSIPSFLRLLAMVLRLWGQGVAPQYRLAVALRITFWANLVLVALTVALVQVFWFEVPVTRHVPWGELLHGAYMAEYQRAAVPQVGWLLGANAAMSAAVWHAIQLASGVAKGPAFLLACALAFAWMALKLGAVWLVLLGIVSLVYRQEASGWRVLGDSGASRGYTVSLLLLFGVYIVLTQINIGGLIEQTFREPPQAAAAPGTPRPTPAVEIDPCQNLREQQHLQVSRDASRELTVRQAQFVTDAESLVNARVERAFLGVEAGVESFLDWNFSIKGQYQQLAFLGASVAGSTTFSDFIAQKIDEHVSAVLSPALQSMAEDLGHEVRDGIRQAYRYHEDYVESLFADASCLEIPQPAIALSDYMEKSLVGAGSGAGVLAARMSSSVGSRVVMRTAVRRMLAAVSARLMSRATAATTAGTAGAFCGPFAWICVPALAGLTWIGTDWVINEIDDAMNRDQMRAEMLAVIEVEKGALKAALRSSYEELAVTVFQDIESYQAQRFNVYRDGR
jgi:hypothetical protein